MEEAPDDGVMALPDGQEAIDMTTAAGEGRPAKRDPRRARRRGRPRKADAKASAPASGRRADGSKARQAFGAVQKMTAEGMTRSQAFEAHAKAVGSNAGTVAANYYREARSHSGAVKARNSRSAAGSAASATASDTRSNGHRRRARASAGATPDQLDAILANISTSMQELLTAVKDRSAETAELRKRLDGLRSLLN